MQNPQHRNAIGGSSGSGGSHVPLRSQTKIPNPLIPHPGGASGGSEGSKVPVQKVDPNQWEGCHGPGLYQRGTIADSGLGMRVFKGSNQWECFHGPGLYHPDTISVGG